MSPGDTISADGQHQFGSFVIGPATHYPVRAFHRKPTMRAFRQPIPGGGDYNPRNENGVLGLITDLDVEGTSVDNLEANWDLFAAAFAVSLDQPYAWRTGSRIQYVYAHVESPADWVHDIPADVGFLRPTSVGLVASDPTIHTV